MEHKHSRGLGQNVMRELARRGGGVVATVTHVWFDKSNQLSERWVRGVDANGEIDIWVEVLS